MGRYKDILNVRSASQVLPSMGNILKQDTDLYITYNSSDRLDLISYRIYGDPQYWWVVLSANDYQIEFDIEYGEILRIPFPLAPVLTKIKETINE